MLLTAKYIYIYSETAFHILISGLEVEITFKHRKTCPNKSGIKHLRGEEKMADIISRQYKSVFSIPAEQVPTNAQVSC